MIPENAVVLVRVCSDADPDRKWWAIFDQKRVMECGGQTTLSQCVHRFPRNVYRAYCSTHPVQKSKLEDYVVFMRRRETILPFEPYPLR